MRDPQYRNQLDLDIVMAGTFSAWRLGTIQSRALPLAQSLREQGVRCAIVTVPWDDPGERGARDVIDGVPLFNTGYAGIATIPLVVAAQLRLIRQLQPRAIHVFKPKGFGGFAGLLARSSPVIVDSDDWEGDGGWNRVGGYNLIQRRVFQWQEQTLLRNAFGVTAASMLLYARARAARVGEVPSRVWYVPNGLSAGWARHLAAAGEDGAPLREEEDRIVVYSRFAEFRADWLPRFVSALSGDELCQRRVTVVVVGHTDTQAVSRRNVTVEYRGYVERTVIPEILGGATVAVYPYEDSLVTRSKNSVKLLELMATGCPVIASDVGDIGPALGGAGLLVDSAAPEYFARVALELLDQPSVLATMREIGPQRVRDRYTTPVLAGRLHEVYRSLNVIRS